MDYLTLILIIILSILITYIIYLNKTTEKEGIFTRRAWRRAGRAVSRTWRSASRAVARVATRAYEWGKARANEIAKKALEYANKVKELALKAWKFLKEQWEALVRLARMVIDFFKKVGRAMDPSPIFRAITSFGQKIASLARQLGDEIGKIAIIEVWISKGIKYMGDAFKKLEVVADGLESIWNEIKNLPKQFELLGRYIRSMGVHISDFIQKIPNALLSVGKVVSDQFNKIGDFFELIAEVIIGLPKKAAKEVGFIK